MGSLFDYWVIFYAFLSSADFFFKINVFEKRVFNSLDPDQAGHFVRPDLGQNCGHADNTRV